MKKYKFKAVNRILQFLLPFLCAADNFAIVFLLCRLGLGILGRIGLADFLLQDPVLDYITKAVLILSVVYSLLPLVMPKGCFLYDDQVVLARYTITALNWKNKIAVPYYMIENAYVQYSSICFLNWCPMATLTIMWSCNCAMARNTFSQSKMQRIVVRKLWQRWSSMQTSDRTGNRPLF